MNLGKKRAQTYLITGRAGFIGSHLADAILARGHRVVDIDNLSTGRFKDIEHLRDHPFSFPSLWSNLRRGLLT